MPEPAEEAIWAMQGMLTGRRRGRGDPFEVAGRRLTPSRVIEILRPYLSEARLGRIEAVLGARTDAVVPVVDGVFDTGNLSAVMRSAEALGYGSFHAVLYGDEAVRGRYRVSNRTTRGAQNWLDVFRWPAPEACAAYLKAQGYHLVAAHPGEGSLPLEAFDFTRPTALVFGNERDGVSPAFRALADSHCLVPMVGFSQSFNVSVAAAVTLYHAYRDRLTRQGYHGDLSEARRETLRALFYLRSVRHASEILERALREE